MSIIYCLHNLLCLLQFIASLATDRLTVIIFFDNGTWFATIVLNIHLIHKLMSKAKNLFERYESAEPEFQQLGACIDHPVRLARWGMINSFTNIDGTTKEKLPAWEDSTPQMFAILVSASGKGSIVIRLNGCGYQKWESLTKEQVESGKFEQAGDYAIIDKDGHKVRLEDEANTESCRNILNQFFAALDMPVKSKIDGLDTAVEEQRTMLTTIVKSEYEGKDQFRATRFKKAAAVVAAEGEGEDWNDGEDK